MNIVVPIAAYVFRRDSFSFLSIFKQTDKSLRRRDLFLILQM